MTHYRKGLWRSQQMVLRSVEGYESDKHKKSFRASPVCFYIAQRLHSTTTTQISTMSTMSWISVVEKNNRTEVATAATLPLSLRTDTRSTSCKTNTKGVRQENELPS